MKKITLFDLIEEGNTNFQKINMLLSKLIRYYSFEQTLKIRKEILDILINSQIISNDTVKNLFCEEND